MTTILTAAASYLLAHTITMYEHRRDPAGFWGQRLGCSRWRRANLPVGGAVLLLAAVPLVSRLLLATALAVAAGAIVPRFTDPLPRARPG